jgi:hypothetical protein
MVTRPDGPPEARGAAANIRNARFMASLGRMNQFERVLRARLNASGRL